MSWNVGEVGVRRGMDGWVGGGLGGVVGNGRDGDGRGINV